MMIIVCIEKVIMSIGIRMFISRKNRQFVYNDVGQGNGTN